MLSSKDNSFLLKTTQLGSLAFVGSFLSLACECNVNRPRPLRSCNWALSCHSHANATRIGLFVLGPSRIFLVIRIMSHSHHDANATRISLFVLALFLVIRMRMQRKSASSLRIALGLFFVIRMRMQRKSASFFLRALAGFAFAREWNAAQAPCRALACLLPGNATQPGLAIMLVGIS